MNICSVPGCCEKVYGKGFCSKHYQRVMKRGSPDDYVGCHGQLRKCAVDGCEKPVEAHGLCSKHYQRFRRHGSHADNDRTHAPLEVRFWRYVQKSEGCWTWVGRLSQTGYGFIQQGGKGSTNVYAHRLSYRMHKGEIPDGMVVMHLCDNPSCVNPNHLQLGSQSQNILDAFAKGRKHAVPPHRFGEAHGASKLKEADVLLIRDSQESSVVLMQRYGVSKSTINRIKQRITWAHLP